MKEMTSNSMPTRSTTEATASGAGAGVPTTEGADEVERVLFSLLPPPKDDPESPGYSDRTSQHYKSHRRRFAIRAALIGGLDGLLFGYDLAVVSGALPGLQKEFHLSTVGEELVASLMLVGAIFGSFTGGFISDGLGRWWSINITSFVSIIACIITSASPTLGGVLVGRYVTGIGMAWSAISDVTYLTEVSPPEYRGAVVSTNELLICVGMLLAFFVDFCFTNVSDGWRYMIAMTGLYPIVQIIFMFTMPESPTWYLSRGEREKAVRSFAVIYNDPQEIIEHMKAAVVPSEGPAHGVRATVQSFKPYATQMALSLILMMEQQFTGNMAVLTYLPEVLRDAGLSQSNSIGIMVVIGFFKVLVTGVTMFLIDRPRAGGRKSFLMRGSLILSLGLLICAIAYSLHGRAVPVFATLGAIIAVCGYGTSFGTVTWVLVSEMFPTVIRGRALGASTVSNWVCNLLVSMTFLSTIKALGVTATFLLYTSSTLIAFLFIRTCLPETLGKTPAEIAQDIPELPAFRAWRAIKTNHTKGQELPVDDEDSAL